MVFVLSPTGKPLKPCRNVIARLLLKTGKAKVKYKHPFTIKLLDEPQMLKLLQSAKQNEQANTPS